MSHSVQCNSGIIWNTIQSEFVYQIFLHTVTRLSTGKTQTMGLGLEISNAQFFYLLIGCPRMHIHSTMKCDGGIRPYVGRLSSDPYSILPYEFRTTRLLGMIMSSSPTLYQAFDAHMLWEIRCCVNNVPI